MFDALISDHDHYLFALMENINTKSVTCTVFMYAYLSGIQSEQAKLDSKYYQRYHAKHSDGHH